MTQRAAWWVSYAARGIPRAALRTAALLICSTLLSAGCASVQLPAGVRPDFTRQKHKRENQAVREFEQHRDFAEYQAALHYWERGDEQDCRRQLDQLLQRNPDYVPARLLQAEVCLAQQRYAEALEEAQGVVDNQPQNAEAHHMMGLVLDAQGRFAEALEHYRRAATLEPDNELYRLGYALAWQSAHNRPAAPGGTCAGQPDSRSAADRRNAQSSSAPAQAGEAGSTLHCLPPPPAGDSRTKGGFAIARSVAVAPVAFAASADRAGRAQVSDRAQFAGSGDASPGVACAGSMDGAVYADPATAGRPSIFSNGPAGPPLAGPAAGLLEHARVALQAGRVAEAEAYFRRAQSLDPHNPQIPLAAGLIALSQRRPELGVRILTSATQRFPDSAALSRLLAVSSYRLGDFEGAQAALEHALSLDNSSALSYLLLGCTLTKLGRPEPAEECFRQARRLDPQYAARL